MLYKYNTKTKRGKSIHRPQLTYKSLNLSHLFCDAISDDDILGLLYMLVGIKPGVRIEISENSFDYIRQIFTSLGFFVLKSDFYVIVREIAFRWAHYIYRRSRPPKGAARNIYVYMSPDRKLCAALKKSEAKGDMVKFGKLLGYPSCCVSYRTKQYFAKPGDLFMSSLKSPALLPFPYLNNVELGIFGFRVLLHHPCRPNCEKSLKLGQKYLRVLRGCDPNYSEFIEKELKSLIICSRDGRVAYSNNYSMADSGIVFNEIKGNAQDHLFKVLKKCRKIVLADKGYYFGNNYLQWPEYKLAIYS